MKRAIFILGLLYVYACTKTEAPVVTPTQPVVQEESIKFTTNLDTGTFNVSDTVPLIITVSSKAPSAGFQYSIVTTWTDSSKQIYKLDTSLSATTLSLNIPGHIRMGNYSISISVTSKSTSSNTSSKTIAAVNIPYVLAINTDLYPNLNWNDHVANKNGLYDINKDGIPDIISYEFKSQNSLTPAIFDIRDYSGKIIYSFNVKNIKPSVRDSLSTLLPVDYGDLNNDGYMDFGLSYMAEWWTGQPGMPGSSAKYYGNFVYLLLSKGNLQYDAIEVLDDPTNPQISFALSLFDWDFDGKEDLMISNLAVGSLYLKNLGSNKFILNKFGSIPFKQRITNKLDFDKDGKLDLVNLYINEKDENNNFISNDNSQILSIMNSKGVTHFPVVGKEITKYIYLNGNIKSAERISMVDGDNDGDMDLIVGSARVTQGQPMTYEQDYFENTGTQFVYKENFIEVDSNLIGELQVWSMDIDKDGDMDLFYPTYRKSTLTNPKGAYFWWENTKQGFKINKKFRFKY